MQALQPHHSAPSPQPRLAIGVMLPRGRFLWSHAAIAVGVAIVLILILATATMLFGEHWLKRLDFFLTSASLILAALLTPLLVSQRLYAQDYPVHTQHKRWQALWIVGTTLALQVVVALFETVVTGAKEASDTVSQSLGLGDNIYRDVLLIISVTIGAPLGEELLFRGLIYRGLRDGLGGAGRKFSLKTSALIGAVVSSLLFTMAHLGDGQIKQWPALFIIGMALVLVYECTGSILAAVLVHSLNNAWAIFSFFMLPDIQPSAPWLYAFVAITPLLAGTLCYVLVRHLPRSPEPPVLPPQPPPLPKSTGSV